MKYCQSCGAFYRINYPFGKKSKHRIHLMNQHMKECKRYTPTGKPK